eukprot:11226424-Lingulodinium_polyedra.AAC.1
MDAVLAADAGAYRRFILDLQGRGLVGWTRKPLERAAVFFVHKKDGMQRMIIDCRRANRRFRAPPGVVLATPECLARLEMESERPLYMCEGDVENCFYNFM